MVREAEKKAKEELLRKIKESAEHQNRVEKKLANILRYEKHCAIQESWAKARMAADNERNNRSVLAS
jgi:hypothetical protein